MQQRPHLRKRIILGLCIYSLILTFAVGLHGYLVNENIEKLVWQTVLNTELDYIKKRLQTDPDFSGSVKDSFYWYDDSRVQPIPVAFKALDSSIHDEVSYGSKKIVVLVEQDSSKKILAMDITHIEKYERMVIVSTLLLTLLVVVLMAFTAYWALGRLIDPILKIARDISTLPPDGVGQRIQLADTVPYESFVISDALNQYMQRIQLHIQREKDFINTASHELRTPISVISGAMEVALNHPETHPALMPHLQRTARIAQEMEELLTFLLALARDKARLRHTAELIDLSAMLPLIIEDHDYLCQGKQLSIQNKLTEPMLVEAPAQLLRVAVSNLVRNAIENSDSGVIRIYAQQNTLLIDDPGHGMSAEEMSALYTRLAKAGSRGFGGIGIELISRICQHYGWDLRLESQPGKGTLAKLGFYEHV